MIRLTASEATSLEFMQYWRDASASVTKTIRSWEVFGLDNPAWIAAARRTPCSRFPHPLGWAMTISMLFDSDLQVCWPSKCCPSKKRLAWEYKYPKRSV